MILITEVNDSGPLTLSLSSPGRGRGEGGSTARQTLSVFHLLFLPIFPPYARICLFELIFCIKPESPLTLPSPQRGEGAGEGRNGWAKWPPLIFLNRAHMKKGGPQ